MRNFLSEGVKRMSERFEEELQMLSHEKREAFYRLENDVNALRQEKERLRRVSLRREWERPLEAIRRRMWRLV
jgi:methylase of polypeptide subunit release factors